MLKATEIDKTPTKKQLVNRDFFTVDNLGDSKFAFGEVYLRIFGRKFSFTATIDCVPLQMKFWIWFSQF